MNFCFIINPWSEIDAETNTTIRLIHETVLRQHNVGIIYPNNLTIRQSSTYGFVRMIEKQDKVSEHIPTFHKRVRFKEQMLPMSGFDVIFVRPDPPLEPVMLNFLDSVKDYSFIINDIDGLRKANNKLYPAAFDDPQNEIIPVTHVSKNKEFLRHAIEESKSDKLILKPYDGYGGRGVIVLEKNAMQNINSLLDYYITGPDKSRYVILQEYIEGAENGDIRILMLNGEPIGAYRRIPAKGDVRSNIHAGGNAEKHILTRAEKQLCERIGPKLVADGLFFVGLDVINGKLLEINVCSPGGIYRINKFNRTKLQRKVIDFAESVVALKDTAIDRKRNFRKLIEDA